MPLLASLISGLFAGFATWLAQWVTRKVAIAAAAVSTFALLTVGFWAAVSTALSGLLTSFPPGDELSLALWLVVPDNATACLSAMVAVDVAAVLYRWTVDDLSIIAFTS